MKEKGQKLKICAKKARAANKRRVAFLAKIATRWIYFIHIFRQLLVPNLSKSEQKNSVLALGAYYTDYISNYFHITMCLRVLRDALVSQVEYLFISASGGRALLQAKGLWLEQVITD